MDDFDVARGFDLDASFGSEHKTPVAGKADDSISNTMVWDVFV